MKSQMRLLECVLADAGTWCSTSTTRDFNTIARRVEHEGMSFLTITLPGFATDFESCLEQGSVEPSHFLSFRKRGALPVFLRGLLVRVFDTSTGTLLSDPDPLAVHAVRQICMLHKKVLLACSDERIRSSYESFLETDRSNAEWEDRIGDVWIFDPDSPYASRHSREESDALGRSSSDSDNFVSDGQHQDSFSDERHRHRGASMELAHFRCVAGLLWGQLFTADSFGIDTGRVVPRHGPGATAEKLSANRRYAQSRWHRRLDHWFPAADFVVPNAGYSEELADIQFVDPEHEQPVRVVAVPKTLKGPRIIAIEPACMQYTQQAVMEILVDRLESYFLSKGRINFADQTANQKMALRGSINGRIATIDLKDASDRVSAQLVWEMLAVQKDFRSLVFACRSLRADVPGEDTHVLSRFASMGSALCFPIEAMVFYTIVVSAIHRAVGLPLTLKGLRKALQGVRVYGDDIIVPVQYVQDVWRELEYFNLRVNPNKTFYRGSFRESCGVDAFRGVPVTPVYCRRMLPTKHRSTAEEDVEFGTNPERIVSAVSLANQLYKAGYWQAASYVRSELSRFATYPIVSENSSVLGWHSYRVRYEAHRWDTDLHRWLVRAPVVVTKLRPDPLDGYGALMKFFLKRGSEPYHDEKHLERYGRPLSVYTKTRWAQPY